MRGLYTDERGISPVVATLLLLSLFIGIYAIYMSVTIPSEFASKEKEHMLEVRDSFLRLQRVVQEMSAGESRSISMPMSANLVSGTFRGPSIGGRLAAVETTVISEDTVALWLMDEGLGTTVQDETANNNDGTVYGADWVGGRYGSALQFDNNDNVEIADSDSLDMTTGLTLEAWVYPYSFPAGDPDWLDTIIAKGNDGTNGFYGLSIEVGRKVEFRIKDSTGTSTTLTSTSTMTENTWYHIAATYDGQNMRVYFNGVEEASTPLTNSIGANTEKLYIGMHPVTGWDYRFDGIIDEVRIENRVLNTSEIAERAKRGTLYFEIQNAYYSPQTYVHEHGAVILAQSLENKSLMVSPTTMIDVTPYGTGDNIKVCYRVLQLMGSSEATSTGTETLTVSVENTWQTSIPDQPNMENVTIAIHSDYRDAWRDYLVGLVEQLGDDGIYAAVDLQNLQLTIHGKSLAAGVKDIYFVNEFKDISIAIS